MALTYPELVSQKHLSWVHQSYQQWFNYLNSKYLKSATSAAPLNWPYACKHHSKLLATAKTSFHFRVFTRKYLPLRPPNKYFQILCFNLKSWWMYQNLFFLSYLAISWLSFFRKCLKWSKVAFWPFKRTAPKSIVFSWFFFIWLLLVLVCLGLNHCWIGRCCIRFQHLNRLG